MKPEIRFKGFTDEWVEKKLGEVLKVPEKVEATVTTNEQLLTVKLHGGGVHVMPSNKLLKLGSTKYYVRKAGQLIYGKQNFFNGSMAIIPSELDGKASSGDVPSFDIVNADSICLYQKISQPKFYKRTEDWASGTGSKRLHEKTIQQFPIQLPSLPEQQKIGALFSKYDTIIALREQKLAELNALKKGLLQQMFPKNGAKVPELRFEGFEDEWEDRKLGEVAEVKYGHDYKNVSQIGNIPVYGTGGVLAMIDKFQSESSDAVGLGRKGTINKPFVLKAPFWTVDTLFQIYPKVSLDLFFQLYLFNNINWLKYNESTGVPSLSKSNIEAVVRNIPSLPEQQKIGQLFEKLDARISNEQTKIAQLKAQKQGLLQRML